MSGLRLLLPHFVRFSSAGYLLREEASQEGADPIVFSNINLVLLAQVPEDLARQLDRVALKES